MKAKESSAHTSVTGYLCHRYVDRQIGWRGATVGQRDLAIMQCQTDGSVGAGLWKRPGRLQVMAEKHFSRPCRNLVAPRRTQIWGVETNHTGQNIAGRRVGIARVTRELDGQTTHGVSHYQHLAVT